MMIPQVPTQPQVLTPERLASPTTRFLNRCTGGCPIRPGTTDSRTDKTSLAGATSSVRAFKGTDAQWQTILACVKDTFSVFNINVTDVDPGTADHFEIMVAGYSSAGTTRWERRLGAREWPARRLELVAGVPVGNGGDRPGEYHATGVGRGEQVSPPPGVEHLGRGGEERREQPRDEPSEEAQSSGGEARERHRARAEYSPHREEQLRAEEADDAPDRGVEQRPDSRHQIQA